MGKKSKSKKNNEVEESEAVKKAPHSFVFHRGKVGIYVLDLIRDMRRVMEPYTATKLKVLKKNVLKDFVSVAAPLGVTHLIVFSRTEISLNMRLVRLPRGPTLTFKVHDYTLNRDVVSSLKKPQTSSQKYFHHPLLVMNNFSSDERHLKLTESAFQNLFPSINVNSIKLNDIQRCLLLDYDAASDRISLRHYAIKVAPSGVSSSVKKLMRKKLPDLSKCADISDYFLKPHQSSDSEGIPSENEIELPEAMQTKKTSSQVGIKLIEVGPRISLQLIKIQEGVCDGEVLYHKFVKKTPVEIAAIKKTKIAKQRLKEKRRKEQERNVAKKQTIGSTSFSERKVKFQVHTTNLEDRVKSEHPSRQENGKDQEPPRKQRKFET